MYRFKVYKDRRGEFRWTLVATNGRTVADSGEGYSTRSVAKDGAERMKQHVRAAPIEDE